MSEATPIIEPSLGIEPASPPGSWPATRRFLLAAIFSAIMPGAGQLFLGNRRKAFVFLVFSVVVASGFWPLRLPRSYPGIMLLICAIIVLWLLAVCDALFGRDRVSPGRLSKWWLLAALPLHYIGVNIFFTSLLFASGFRTLQSAASAMEPTIMRGERFVSDMSYYRRAPERRGDLVVVSRQDLLTVKRIAAVGGDTIQGKDQQVFLNGQLQTEPFVQHKFPVGRDPQLDTFGPVVVPSGKYFVMGDNRDISLDSRTPDFGLVDTMSIVGKPLYAYHFSGQPLSRELN
jgi:signal peptidase I